MSILVAGTIALDNIETPFGSMASTLGGSATHFAAAASFYSRVNLVSVIGPDLDQRELDFLRQRHVDMRGVQVVEGSTFRWAGRYDYDMNSRETLETQLNVFTDFRPTIPDDYRRSQYIFLANMDPEQQRLVLEQVDQPQLTLMDTMDLWIQTRREELVRTMRMVDMVTMNDSEVRMFGETISLVAAARQVLELGPRAVLIKKGEHGALLFTRTNEYFAAPAYPLEDVRDPTGAGDSFAGGFLGFIAECGQLNEDILKRAVIHGSAVASYTVEDYGVRRMRTLTRSEIDRRYQEFRTFTHFEPI
ncbi:MAG TPA: PfkB family carbohydrate kinase [Dehalococcoidia bacterium]|nr:PfkB family carbohydrate kinase [Dehalococcoidia bacterium]